MAQHTDVGAGPSGCTLPESTPEVDTVDMVDQATQVVQADLAGHHSLREQASNKQAAPVTAEQKPLQRASIEHALPAKDVDVAQLSFNNLTDNYIYAVGVLKPVFPNQGLQQAFYRAARTLKVSEYDYYLVLSFIDPANGVRPYFYIAEQIKWVLSIHDIDSYILLPRSKQELMCFIKALKPTENSLLSVLSTAIGVIDNSGLSQELNLPKVICNNLFSQTLDSLHEKLKAETGVTTSVIQDVLQGLEYQPNNGRGNFSRAKNYLAYRYPDIYLTTHALKNGPSANDLSYFLNDVKASYSDLASPHVIVDLVLTYKSKSSRREKYYHCSVDVTHQFPFVNAPLQAFMPLTLMTG
ncbi:hypothetical protein L2755_19700 [Shewanella abyssi]|uniref:cyanobactin maturation protease PatG family protein n=1 Tax=Shewanella abyssi TaxID=311789 RepID=UPI00200BE1A7|nr:hypothetical protein [Shewanella abyssi]MCL1051831.1 hypothetical protein [Shewanella abyssi]